MNGFVDWVGSSELAAQSAGKGPWLVRKLCEWTHALIHDKTDIPTHSYGKFNSSILEDKDLAEEIHLHLQSLGPYIKAADIVQYLNTPEVKQWLNLKKPMSEHTAQCWMHCMEYQWKKTPQGQYADDHEQEAVIAYWQNVFLPAMAHLKLQMTQWKDDGTVVVDDIGCLWVILWCHDELTFYANDWRLIHWVHISETVKSYVKGEGVLMMVADYVSPKFGFLCSPDKWVEFSVCSTVVLHPAERNEPEFYLKQARPTMGIIQTKMYSHKPTTPWTSLTNTTLDTPMFSHMTMQQLMQNAKPTLCQQLTLLSMPQKLVSWISYAQSRRRLALNALNDRFAWAIENSLMAWLTASTSLMTTRILLAFSKACEKSCKHNLKEVYLVCWIWILQMERSSMVSAKTLNMHLDAQTGVSSAYFIISQTLPTRSLH